MPCDFTVWTPSWIGLADFASISCVQFFSPGSWYLFCDTHSQMKRWRFSVYYRFVYSFSRSFQLSFIYIYIYIYIYTRFQKGFHIERYIDRYTLLFSCTCASVHFSLVIVQLVKKFASTIIFFFIGFLVPIWKEHVVWIFLRKCMRPAI